MGGLDDLQPLELDYSQFLDDAPLPNAAAPAPGGVAPVAAGAPGAPLGAVAGAAGVAEVAPEAQVVRVPEKPRISPAKRIHYNAPVTLTFTLLSLAVLGLAYLTHGSSSFYFSASRGSFADPFTYIRLFTHVLGHADWQHFINNFMMILLLGPILEEKYGSGKLALMIVITALITGLLHILFSPAGILGASGVVFMMILLASVTNMEAGRIPLTLILILVLYIGQEVVSWATTDTNIAHSAHIIGGLCGAAFGMILGKRHTDVDELAAPQKVKLSKLDRQAAKQLAKGRQL